MIYFRNNDDIIEKYQIDFDKDELEKLKNEIINNCSFIEHVEYASDFPPRFTNKIIKNYTYTRTGEQKEYFEEVRDIYLYSYDEYKPPYLVELINQLLNDNSKAIDQIINYDTTTKPNIDDRINLINQEFNKIAPEDITKKEEKLNELKDLLKSKELNKNQQGIELYYDKLIELIQFNFVDSLSIDEFSKIESFFKVNLSSKVDISNSKGKSFVKFLKNK
ncbi:MAG: hypothetical protein IJ134_05355 [Bacilli bacterium]|nr:hypothetical protein [Bacilli bacterium]